MNADYVKKRVFEISERAKDGDDEAAHSLVDSLYRDVLEEISLLDGNPAGELAKAALEAEKVKFSRWCA